MNASITHVFYIECDRCREIRPDTTETGRGCYCPDCLEDIAHVNANPLTAREARDERTQRVAGLFARYELDES